VRLKFGIRRRLNNFANIYSRLFFKLYYLLFGFERSLLLLPRYNKHSQLLVLKDFGASIGNNCDIETGLIFHNCQDFRNLIIGNNCHIGKNCFFDLRDKVIIEDNVVVSMQCTFITHQDLTKSDLSKKYPASSSPIFIKRNAYIGVNTTILQNTVIEDNCIIAAGSLVIKSTENNSIFAGVPARKIKEIILEI
jgi:acetyltransferase-like isoleucine patch superfamily enzyme